MYWPWAILKEDHQTISHSTSHTLSQQSQLKRMNYSLRELRIKSSSLTRITRGSVTDPCPILARFICSENREKRFHYGSASDRSQKSARFLGLNDRISSDFLTLSVQIGSRKLSENLPISSR